MIEESVYDEKFYENRNETLHSAIIIVPLLQKMLKIESVVDVGCGPAEWLGVFARNGVTSVLGLDGEWVDKKILKIPQDKFISTDLKKPIVIDRTFDLAMSLEVAEHLPATVADQFVDSLTRLAPIVLFSAAIPLQGGSYHINEQWPKYWCNLFAARRFVGVDCLRSKIWNNKDVCWWYSQNMILFVRHDVLDLYPEVKVEYERNEKEVLPLIHPRLFSYFAKRHNALIGLIPGPVKWVYRKFFKK